MKNDIIKTITKFIFPFIVALSFYVQINGSNAPGGGFQSGVIMSAAFILFSMVFGSHVAEKALSIKKIKFLAVIGIFLYAGTGLLCMLLGGEFLEYNFLENSLFEKQTLGISMIEWGVGITVFSVFSLIYNSFSTAVGSNSTIGGSNG